MECQPKKRVVTGDYNFDGQPDRLTVTTSPNVEQCGNTEYVLELGKGSDQYVQAFSSIRSGEPKWGWFGTTSEAVWAHHEPRGKAFHVHDLVGYSPDGRRVDRERIEGIDFHIDNNLKPGGWRAYVLGSGYPLNSGWLRFISPARRLDVITYELTGAIYQEQSARFAQRQLLLSQDGDQLTAPNREKVIAIEKRIAASLQRHMQRLKLDHDGVGIVVSRLSATFGFHASYQSLVAHPGTVRQAGGGSIGGGAVVL